MFGWRGKCLASRRPNDAYNLSGSALFCSFFLQNQPFGSVSRLKIWGISQQTTLCGWNKGFDSK